MSKNTQVEILSGQDKITLYCVTKSTLCAQVGTSVFYGDKCTLCTQVYSMRTSVLYGDKFNLSEQVHHI